MKVIFIPKPSKDDYTHPKAFRPITLSSFLFKGLKKILQWYLQDTFIQTPLYNQYAFTHGCSTEHTISRMVDKVENQILQGKYALCAALNIEGASIKDAMMRLTVNCNIVQWYYSRSRFSRNSWD